MANNPLISVIIPAYNRERYIGEAIQSILDQRYIPLEIVVINDGSTDGTRDAALQFEASIIYIEQQNGGIGSALNTGLGKVTGEYIGMLDSDDLWMNNKITLQLPVLQEKKDVGMVFGYIENFHSPELDENTKKRIYCPPDPMPGLSKSTMLAKRDIFGVVGGFDERLLTTDFIDWYARAQLAGIQSVMLQQTIARRRLHENNTMARTPGVQIEYARTMRAKLIRERDLNNTG